MINKEVLKKQIIYRSTHRGSKEMDILLGSFVKKYVNRLTYDDLINLDKIFREKIDIKLIENVAIIK